MAKVPHKMLGELSFPEIKGGVMEKWEGPEILKEEYRVTSEKKEKKCEAYDLWTDLSSSKKDIIFGQLLQISFIARKIFKKGMPMARRKQRENMRVVARVQLPTRPHDVKAV